MVFLLVFFDNYMCILVYGSSALRNARWADTRAVISMVFLPDVTKR